MSKTKFDRKNRQQRWESDYFRMGGGLDQRSAALSIKPGRLLQVVNWEEVFGKQGYSFVKGYERYDGRARPSQASYWTLAFGTGTVAFTPGATVSNGLGASAIVVSSTLTSGTFGGGNAVGQLVLTEMTGSWASGNSIVGHAVATGDSELGSAAESDYETNLSAARELLRALIQKVPGTGSVLGVAVFNGFLYAVRAVDELGVSAAAIYKSSAAGWTLVKDGVSPEAPYRFEVANFTGAADRLALFGVNGAGRLFEILKDDTVTFAAPLFGSEATSPTSNTSATGSKTWTITQTARDWIVGDILQVSVVGNIRYRMVGDITAYNSGSGVVTINVTEADAPTGGAFTDWEFGLADFTDKPYIVREHKNHLFLAYPNGQLQTSDLGEPMQATTTAALFGVGQEIQELLSLKGQVLGIFCSEKIDVLEGSSALDWNKAVYSKAAGITDLSVQDNNGNALYMDTAGLTSMQATQNFGNFESAVFSTDVKKTLDAYRTRVIGSRMAVGNYQYRLYFDDGSNLRFTFLAGGTAVRPSDVSAGLAQYIHTPSCFADGRMADGQKRMFFGTTDGYVMEEDIGTSYDGTAIFYIMRLPFNHMKAPAIDKQFHKIELEGDSSDPITIYYRVFFDYDDGTFEHASGSIEFPGQGGQFDVDELDTFQFDRPLLSRQELDVDGMGRNVSILFWVETAFARPLTLQGLMTFFTNLGVRP